MAKSKRDALAIVFECAQKYRDYLADRCLLFVCLNKYKQVYCLEVTFDGSNFQHLTGLKIDKKKISPKDFYNRCLEKRLSIDDFEFSAIGTTEMKLDVLPFLMCKNLSAKMIGNYNMSQPKLYTEKLAGGISASIGFVKNGGNGRYIPNMVLKGDIRDKTQKADRVIATYRKKRKEERYSELVYLAKKIDWSRLLLPEEYNYLSISEYCHQ